MSCLATSANTRLAQWWVYLFLDRNGMLYFLLYLQQIYYIAHHCAKRGDVVGNFTQNNEYEKNQMVDLHSINRINTFFN